MMATNCGVRARSAMANEVGAMVAKKAHAVSPVGGKTVVDRVIAEFCEGNLSEMARQLTLRTQRYVSRQQVHGWVTRGQFPPEWIEDIHAWTKIPVRDLLHRSRPRS